MDVIPDALSWPEAHQTLTTESSAVNQTVEEPLGFVKHPPGLCACRSVVCFTGAHTDILHVGVNPWHNEVNANMCGIIRVQ